MNMNKIKALLADHDIAAHDQRNALQTCFIALFAHTAAVKLALTVQRRYHDGIGTGLDCRRNVFLLRHHNAQVYDLKSGLCEGVVEDFVADRMNIGANDADD